MGPCIFTCFIALCFLCVNKGMEFCNLFVTATFVGAVCIRLCTITETWWCLRVSATKNHLCFASVWVQILIRKVSILSLFFHSCTVHLDTIESFIYPTDAQIDCSKNVKIYVKIYMRGAATCFGFSQPSSGSYYMCFAKVTVVNNQLKYVVYRICSV